jgi:amino acid adenylation domain-containing protein
LKSGSRGDSLAHVLYTSGSTGKPKGVCITHRGISRLVLNTNYLQIRPHDVVAQGASISFDAATLEIWGALLNGAKLVIVPREVALSPKDFAAELHTRGITVLFLTTTLFNLMVRAEPDALASVRCVMFGGEAADATIVRELIEHGAPEKLLNLYGPTETTTLATWFDARRLNSRTSNVLIGLPIANTDVHVFDKHGEVAPIGVRGELFIGGDGVASGYWNQPELTAEKFVERYVFGTRRRLYRSGDIVRRLPDGNIEFLGRADNQVKIRGFRVELGEIEIALKQHAAVRDTVVVLHGSDCDKRIIAYVTLRNESRLAGDDLRRWLTPKLPEHMMPAQVILIATMPINANGKVDRAALPAPYDQTRSAVIEVKPWIPLQLQLLQIWRELLGVRNVGVRDNFFELGGHSLLAVRLMDRIEHVCGVKAPVSTLFTASTVEQLSEVILKQQFGVAKPLIEIQPSGTRAPIFFLHGDLLGGGLYCLNLARQLGLNHPFFALPPARVDEHTVPSIEEMATEHLRVVRAHRPHGPYIIGGFCIAGLVALEIAQRLAADGERVEMLVLADPPLPSFLRFARRVVETGARMNREPMDEQLQDFFTCYRRLCRLRELRAKSFREQWRFIKQRFTKHRVAEQARTDASAERDSRAAYLWSAAGYKPRAYRHPAQLFCCDDAMAPLKKKLSAWRDLLPLAETHIVGSEHLDLVTTRADELATHLRHALGAANRTGTLKAGSFCMPLADAHG